MTRVPNEVDEIVKLKHGATERRWLVAVKDKALDGIRALPLLETRAEHFLRALESGKVSANIYLRRIHNFALGTLSSSALLSLARYPYGSNDAYVFSSHPLSPIGISFCRVRLEK